MGDRRQKKNRGERRETDRQTHKHIDMWEEVVGGENATLATSPQQYSKSLLQPHRDSNFTLSCIEPLLPPQIGGSTPFFLSHFILPLSCQSLSYLPPWFLLTFLVYQVTPCCTLPSKDLKVGTTGESECGVCFSGSRLPDSVPANLMISFIFITEQHFIAYMYYGFIMALSIKGHLVCFHFLVIVNRVAMRIADKNLQSRMLCWAYAKE